MYQLYIEEIEKRMKELNIEETTEYHDMLRIYDDIRDSMDELKEVDKSNAFQKEVRLAIDQVKLLKSIVNVTSHLFAHKPDVKLIHFINLSDLLDGFKSELKNDMKMTKHLQLPIFIEYKILVDRMFEIFSDFRYPGYRVFSMTQRLYNSMDMRDNEKRMDEVEHDISFQLVTTLNNIRYLSTTGKQVKPEAFGCKINLLGLVDYLNQFPTALLSIRMQQTRNNIQTFTIEYDKFYDKLRDSFIFNN